MSSTTEPRPRSPVREQILKVAAGMFYRQGIVGTGVDTIIERAGVSKMSLYRHFGSKEQLIAECLEGLDRRYHDWFVEQVEAGTKSPTAKLLSIFDVLDDWFHSSRFRGCAFINAAVELSDPDHPAKKWVLHHKQQDRLYIQKLAEGAGVPNATRAARQLMLLAEGAIVTALVQGDLNAARDAKQVASCVIGSTHSAPRPRTRHNAVKLRSGK